MITCNKIWKNISRQLKYAKNSPQESVYQSAIYDIITDSDYLGWPVDRVKREFPVQMGSITVQTVKPNINSTPFYRKNKADIVDIILSPYDDPNRE